MKIYTWYNDLKVNIFDGEVPYGDGSTPVQYEFKEMFVLRLAMVIQEGEDDKSVAPPVTIATLKKRYVFVFKSLYQTRRSITY